MLAADLLSVLLLHLKIGSVCQLDQQNKQQISSKHGHRHASANATSNHCKCLPVSTTASGGMWLAWLMLCWCLRSMLACREVDMCLSELAGAVPVEVMPGNNDPANHSLPQQPLHRCLFPLGSSFTSFNRYCNQRLQTKLLVIESS